MSTETADIAGRFDLAGRRIWVAGHGGMVGSAICRRLSQVPGVTLLTVDRSSLDLTRQAEVEAWMLAEKPEVVVLAAAKVGGIEANRSFPVDFLRDNLAIETNVIHAAHLAGVRKLMLVASTCIYPRLAPQPMREADLMTGPLEPTNKWFAVAKIAGVMLCQAYRQQYGDDFVAISVTNLFGPGDNYHPEESHVPAALLRRFHEAKEGGAPEVVVWGTGEPLREFMYIDDMADAAAFLLERYSESDLINVGSGQEISIGEFARAVASTVGYQGELVFDTDKPNGAPRKLVDSSRLAALGWRATTPIPEALRLTYQDFLAGGGRNRDVA